MDEGRKSLICVASCLIMYGIGVKGEDISMGKLDKSHILMNNALETYASPI